MSNIIRDREEDLVRAFKFGLEQAAKALDEGIAEGRFPADDVPTAMLGLHFTFPKANLEISAMPEFDLAKPIPDPIPEPKAYEVGGPDDPDRTIQP